MHRRKRLLNLVKKDVLQNGTEALRVFEMPASNQENQLNIHPMREPDSMDDGFNVSLNDFLANEELSMRLSYRVTMKSTHLRKSLKKLFEWLDFHRSDSQTAICAESSPWLFPWRARR
jgi:hypothetical protein